MKRNESNPVTSMFGGLFSVIADALARKDSGNRAASLVPVIQGGLAVVDRTFDARRGATAPVSIFERVDRWFWNRHVRETEAWLAQSQDLAELEERLRRLERSASGPWN